MAGYLEVLGEIRSYPEVNYCRCCVDISPVVLHWAYWLAHLLCFYFMHRWVHDIIRWEWRTWIHSKGIILLATKSSIRLHRFFLDDLCYFQTWHRFARPPSPTIILVNTSLTLFLHQKISSWLRQIELEAKVPFYPGRWPKLSKGGRGPSFFLLSLSKASNQA